MEHLAGDSPEIDRWKAQCRNLEARKARLREALRKIDEKLKRFWRDEDAVLVAEAGGILRAILAEGKEEV